MTTQPRSLNHSYIERIIYSKQFRGLQDKTQLFYPSQQNRVRTRLTHTIEVRMIAHRIAIRLNEKISSNPAILQAGISPTNLELIDAIAFAHDIGHTPFGHVGERTIDAIVSGKDDLGGLIKHNTLPAMRFKHNVNSLRVLTELGINDWRITEGALSHTKIFYGNDNTAYSSNPYHPFAKSSYDSLIRFIFQNNNSGYSSQAKVNPSSLTLEGQIVAIADEIAQRAADIGDAEMDNKYLSKIQRMLKPPNPPHDGATQGQKKKKKKKRSTSRTPYSNTEQIILETMTADVVNTTMENLRNATPTTLEYNGISHSVYSTLVVCFSSAMKTKNAEIERIVTKYSAQSEIVRESDSRSKYIIRQLYKAYVNDITLMPDRFIEQHLTRIADKFSNDLNNFNRIKKKKWYVSIAGQNGNGRGKWKAKLLDFDVIGEYFQMLKDANNNASSNPIGEKLFNAFLLDVGFFIADMTNTEAFEAYNKIYGHTL